MIRKQNLENYNTERKGFDILLEKLPDFYVPTNEEKKIIASMVQMANLTRKGFEQKDISIVMSPRTVIMWAENYKIIKDIKNSLKFTFLNKCDESEIDIYKEYFQRTFAIDI